MNEGFLDIDYNNCAPLLTSRPLAIQGVVPKNRKVFLSGVSNYNSFGYNSNISNYLQYGFAKKFISKADLIFFYKKIHYVTIEALWLLPRLSEGGAFTKEELLALVQEEPREISSDDLEFLFQRIYYRAETFPFNKESLRSWFFDKYIDGGCKINSLIGIALQKMFPGEITFEDVEEKINFLIRCFPDDHGITRYIALMFIIADEDHEKQTYVIDYMSDVIIAYLRKGHENGKMLLDTLKGYTDITDGQRAPALAKIREFLLDEARRLQTLSMGV